MTKAWDDYVSDLVSSIKLLGQPTTSYLRGPVLLRVSAKLTPDQAAEYEAALDAFLAVRDYGMRPGPTPATDRC